MCQPTYNRYTCQNCRTPWHKPTGQWMQCNAPAWPLCKINSPFVRQAFNAICERCAPPIARNPTQQRPAYTAPQAQPETFFSTNFGPGDMGHLSRGASPRPYPPSRPLSQFVDRGPGSPPQPGVIYDSQGRPLRAGIVPRTGPQSTAEAFQNFARLQRQRYAMISDESIRYNWEISKADRVYGWTRDQVQR